MEGDSLIPVYFSFLLLTGGEIAGISVGGLVGFIVLILVLICCTKHCCCKKTKKSADIKVTLETQLA